MVRIHPTWDEVVYEITQLGMEHAPWEVGGIILDLDQPGYAMKMIKNSSEVPHTNTLLKSDDVLDALSTLLLELPMRDLTSSMIFWHTHPGGHEGPSPIDIENRSKAPDVRFMVVSIPSGKAVNY